MKSVLIILALTIMPTAFSQTTVDKCKPLDELIGKINSKKRYNFSSVNKIYSLSRTTKCDDGVYAEGMSDIVVQSLIKDFVRTVKVAGKNKSAADFVVAHVNSTSSKDDLRRVSENSKRICPAEKKDVCKRIEEASSVGMKKD